MYKVLIVDDEKLMRINLKNLIEWSEHDCEVIGLAKDGVEALELFEKHKPDIVLTDLKMPKMDGVELIRNIKLKDENTQILVLSNYNEYELVRTAMKFGAYDYLLKVTLEEDELVNALNSMKELINVKPDNQIATIKNELELTRNLLMIKNKDNVIESEFNELFKEECKDIVNNKYNIAYFRIDDINQLYKEGKFENRIHLKTSINDIFVDNLGQILNYKIIFIKNHSGLLLVNPNPEVRLLSLLNKTIKDIKQYLNVSMTITISHQIPSSQEFLQEYSNVLTTHDLKFYVGNETIIEAAFMPQQNSINRSEFNKHIVLLETLKIRDFSKARSIKNEICEYVKDNFIRPAEVKDLINFVLNNVEAYESIKGLKNLDRFTELHKIVDQVETLDDLDDGIEMFFTSIELWLKDDMNLKYRKEIRDVIDFVDRNLQNKVSLSVIADSVNMNESYLSRTFKSETGVNLINFINERKMKRAAELLLDTRIMIKEVAYMVGIDDQFYFNKVFKKYTGFSPSEYRKKINN